MEYFRASSATALTVGPAMASAVVPANSSGRQAMSTPRAAGGFQVLDGQAELLVVVSAEADGDGRHLDLPARRRGPVVAPPRPTATRPPA